MRKLGLIGRWGVLPSAGLRLTLEKPHTFTITVNTTEKTVFVLEDEAGAHNRLEPAPLALLGAVDGLETFEVRVNGPCRIKALQYDRSDPSQVWYHTDEGQNYAIDTEHLKDFTVPMIGRRERNEALDALRFEMRQEMRQQQAMFAEFMAYQRGVMTPPQTKKDDANGQSDQTNGDTDAQSGNGAAQTADTEEGGNGGSSAESDPKRAVPPKQKLQQPANAGNKDGGASSDT